MCIVSCSLNTAVINIYFLLCSRYCGKLTINEYTCIHICIYKNKVLNQPKNKTFWRQLCLSSKLVLLTLASYNIIYLHIHSRTIHDSAVPVITLCVFFSIRAKLFCKLYSLYTFFYYLRIMRNSVVCLQMVFLLIILRSLTNIAYRPQKMFTSTKIKKREK